MMNGPVIRMSGFIALIPWTSKSGQKMMRVALMKHPGHQPRILWKCSDSDDPDTCAMLSQPLAGNMEMIVENGGTLKDYSNLDKHVHHMKSLDKKGDGKADAQWLKRAPNKVVKGLLDISSGALEADPKSIKYEYTYNGLGNPAKPLAEVVHLKLPADAKVTLIRVDNGKKILDQHTDDFWIVNQMTKDFFCKHLHRQRKIRHFEDMYGLLGNKNPVRYIPEADCDFYDDDCNSSKQKGHEKASRPVKCPVALFEETNF